MLYLNLDHNFKPFAGKEIPFETLQFSGGEPHIRLQTDFDHKEAVTITHRINCFNDFGMLIYAIDALKRLLVNDVSVFIPYFPAARQDRVMLPGEPLSVKVNAQILNRFDLKEVMVYDAHSDVTAAVLNHCIAINNHEFVRAVLQKINKPVKLVSPDGGALKKIYKLAERLGGYDVIECSKRRDVKTGKLSEFIVYADDLQGADCLIVDDICDGGGTFCGLAEVLKQKHAGDLYVAASHGIFSKGFVELDKWFRHLFSTNSIKDFRHEKLTQIKLNADILQNIE